MMHCHATPFRSRKYFSDVTGCDLIAPAKTNIYAVNCNFVKCYSNKKRITALEAPLQERSLFRVCSVYGKKVMTVQNFGHLCLGALYVFFFFRLLLGAFNNGYSVAGYALLLEVIGPSKRTVVGMGLNAFFSISCGLMALLAYYIRGWRTLIMVSSFLGAALLATWRYREIYNSTPNWKPYIPIIHLLYHSSHTPELQGGCWYKVGRSKIWQRCLR